MHSFINLKQREDKKEVSLLRYLYPFFIHDVHSKIVRTICQFLPTIYSAFPFSVQQHLHIQIRHNLIRAPRNEAKRISGPWDSGAQNQSLTNTTVLSNIRNLLQVLKHSSPEFHIDGPSPSPLQLDLLKPGSYIFICCENILSG